MTIAIRFNDCKQLPPLWQAGDFILDILDNRFIMYDNSCGSVNRCNQVTSFFLFFQQNLGKGHRLRVGDTHKGLAFMR